MAAQPARRSGSTAPRISAANGAGSCRAGDVGLELDISAS
jgi:hypothetical protein